MMKILRFAKAVSTLFMRAQSSSEVIPRTDAVHGELIQ
jgi:hypothetical protein